MYDNNISCQISHIAFRLNYYTRLFFSTSNAYEKMYYVNLISNELFWLNGLNKQLEGYMNKPSNTIQQREFTLAELANFNGAIGKPAYVAVNGVVYDVSLEATWGGGSHFGLIAGKDLTNQFESCHEREAILNSLPVVGVLV